MASAGPTPGAPGLSCVEEPKSGHSIPSFAALCLVQHTAGWAQQEFLGKLPAHFTIAAKRGFAGKDEHFLSAVISPDAAIQVQLNGQSSIFF